MKFGVAHAFSVMIPSFFVWQILLSLLLAALVAGFAYLLLERWFAKASAAFAIALGFLTGFFVISGLGGYAFPPKTIQNWLPHIAAGALALGLLETWWLKNTAVRWVLRIALLELLLWQLFQPYINHPFPTRRWNTTSTLLNLGITSLLILSFWLALDLMTKRKETSGRAAALVPTALMLIVAGSAIGVVLAHSLVMAQLTGVLAATIGAIAVACWLFPKLRLSSAATPLITLLLALPWLGLYTTLPIITVLLLALAPWLLFIRFNTYPLVQRSLFQTLLVALPVVLAILNAWRLS